MPTYSNGTIRKRNVHGKWQWQGLIIVQDDDGTKHQRTKLLGMPCDPLTDDERGRGRRVQPTGKGARQALTALRKWRDELTTQESTNTSLNKLSGRLTTETSVADYVQAYWNSRSIEPETQSTYEYILRHIKRLDVPMSGLDVKAIREWVALLKKEEVGASMLHKTVSQLRYACEWAVENGDLTSNPVLKRDIPKRPKRELNPLDDKERQRLIGLLSNIQSTKPVLASATLLALASGMRQGEICALSWKDIDEEHIHVRNAIARNKGSLRLKPYTKNGERRDIPLNDTLRGILADRKTLCQEFLTEPIGYVYANPMTPDQYPSPAVLGKQWNLFASMFGVKGVAGTQAHFHDLRHTFATYALTHGQDVVSVASILGHLSTTTTLQYYARWLPNSNKRVMNNLDDILNEQDDEEEE